MRSLKSGVVFAVAVAVLGGCAVLDARPPEEVVKERAQQRWDAMVKSDFKASYQFLSPASRALTSAESYSAGLKTGFWKTATVERVICERPDVCDALMGIEYDFRGSRIKTPLKETWIKEGSSWWFVPK